MPTYRNDNNHTVQVLNTDGDLADVLAGASIATPYIPTVANMTQTAAAPDYNPVVARSSLSSTGVGDDKTVVLNSATVAIFIWKVVGGVASVFYDALANVPAAAILRPGDTFGHDLKRRAAQLVIQFSAAGTCEVLELSEPL